MPSKQKKVIKAKFKKLLIELGMKKRENKTKFSVGQKVFVHEELSKNAYDFWKEYTVVEVLNSYKKYEGYDFKPKYLVRPDPLYTQKDLIVEEKNLYEFDERIKSLSSLILEIAKASIYTSEVFMKKLKGEKSNGL